MSDRAAHSGAVLLVTAAALAAIHSAVLTRQAVAENPPGPATQLACDLAQSIASASPEDSIQPSIGVFSDDALPEPVRGCRLVITGSFRNTPPGEDAASRLRRGFAARGWQEMLAYTADGKDGTAFALRKGEVACLFRGIWNGGSDDEPSVPEEQAYRVNVLCTRQMPPEERKRQP